MAVNFLKLVKPSDFNLNNQLFWNSPLQSWVQEIVARNVVFISFKNGDKWEPFSFKEYSERCNHKDKWGEEIVLNSLVKRGVLSFFDDKYKVTNEFFGTFFKFIEKEQ